jgi:hypothetical protein
VCSVSAAGEYAFEYAERVGAERYWHLSGSVVVRAPEGVDAPERGTRVSVAVPPEKVRRFG